MKLTKLIIEHWKIWMGVPEETNAFGSYDEELDKMIEKENETN